MLSLLGRLALLFLLLNEKKSRIANDGELLHLAAKVLPHL